MDCKMMIREVADFPVKGVLFYDLMPLLASPAAMGAALGEMQRLCEGVEFDCFVAIEARGFLFAAPVADRMGKGFVAMRKQGKLPGATRRVECDLEYGHTVLEMQADALQPGMRVILVDDVLATGGTAEAACNLISQFGAEVVKTVCFVELRSLGGRERLKDVTTVNSVVEY